MGKRLLMDHVPTTLPVVWEDSSTTKIKQSACPTNGSEKTKSTPSRLRRQGTQLMSALKALAHSGPQNPVTESSAAAQRPPKHKTPTARELPRMPSSLFLASSGPTVIRADASKGQHSLLSYTPMEPPDISQVAETRTGSSFANTSSSSSGNSGNNSDPAISPEESTGETSLDSKFQPPTSGMDQEYRALEKYQGTQRHGSSGEWYIPGTWSSPGSNLATIQESRFDQVTPSVVTVERAAAAKIYLETHFNELLASGPTPRSIRQRLLEADIYKRISERSMSPAEQEWIWLQFYRRESEYLREMRVMKARSIRALNAKRGSPLSSFVDDYEVIEILGKGSFGVVQLVREKTTENGGDQNSLSFGGGDGEHGRERKQIYAMKVIRKSKMLQTSQEGHIRAERDFLVASEGSDWIIPLVSSFQDATNLYLVMEYMPGGDFLALLVRENILDESAARFYVAEMIVCVEEAHALKCIHRDIKPDNFLISASGHLKIGDFSLAFDGHWSHDPSYYNSHRYSLLQKLSIKVDTDEEDKHEEKRAQGIQSAIERHERNSDDGEPLLNWRNRCGIRAAAESVVGTSQYMAPEVINREPYDARCDWWSIGVILYECVYGNTPFLSDEGRQRTKDNITNHSKTFALPSEPAVSDKCRHLISSLIREKEKRICSKRYYLQDFWATSASQRGRPGRPNDRLDIGPSRQGPRDFAGRHVFPYDAEDIKSHPWFNGFEWGRLHDMKPPFIPHLRSVDDTQYFGEVEDMSDSTECEATGIFDAEAVVVVALANSRSEDSGNASSREQNLDFAPYLPTSANMGPIPQFTNAYPVAALTAAEARARAREQEARARLLGLRPSVQDWAMAAIASPYYKSDLKAMYKHIEGLADLGLEERVLLKDFVRFFGKLVLKPRDCLLRDPKTKDIVLELRKRTAFLGYTWRRIRPLPLPPPRGGLGGMNSSNAANRLGPRFGGGDGTAEGAGRWEFDDRRRWDGGPSRGNVASMRALHRGRLKLRPGNMRNLLR